MYHNKPIGLHTMEISNNQRSDLLRAHNNLKKVISYVDDCRDINVSHLRDIEEAICVLHEVGEFRPKRDNNNHSMFWSDWVYAENAEPDND